MKRFTGNVMLKLKDRQTLLKMVLLVALIGNISFEPLKQKIQETNLSQEEAITPGAAAPAETVPAPAKPAAATQETKKNEPTEIDALRKTLAQQGAELQKLKNAVGRTTGTTPMTTAITDQQKTSPPHQDNQEEKHSQELPLVVCGGDNKLEMSVTEVTDLNGKVRTSVRLPNPTTKSPNNLHTYPSTAGTWEANQEKIERGLQAAAEKVLCPGKKSAEEKRQELADKKEKEELDEKVDSCEMRKVTSGGKIVYVDFMSSEGKESLSNDELRKERLQCQVDHLDSAFYRDNKSSKEKILKSAERIVNKELRGEIKRMVNSSDDEVAEEGQELATRLIDELDNLKDARDFSSSQENKIEKMMHAMQGIRAGGELARRSREYKEEAKDIKDDYRTAYSAWKEDPSDGFRQSEVYALERSHRELQNEILRDSIFRKSISNFADFNRQHYLEPDEVRLFSSPYNELRYELDLYGDGALGNSRDGLGGRSDGFFSNLYEARTGRTAQRRWNGFDPYSIDRDGQSGFESRYGVRSAFGGRDRGGMLNDFDSPFGSRDGRLGRRTYDESLPFSQTNDFGRGRYGVGRTPSTSFDRFGSDRMDNRFGTGIGSGRGVGNDRGVGTGRSGNFPSPRPSSNFTPGRNW